MGGFIGFIMSEIQVFIKNTEHYDPEGTRVTKILNQYIYNETRQWLPLWESERHNNSPNAYKL